MNGELIESTDKKLLFDDKLFHSLKFEKKRVFQDNDTCILITGEEGVGKTVTAASVSYMLGYNSVTKTSNFNIDYIVFTMKQLEEACKKAKQYQVIMIDEFVLMALSTDALTSMQKDLKKYFVTHRYKNLIYVMVIPSIFMLGDYFATHRSSMLIHCYSPDRITRGYFRLYNKPDKHALYYYGKKMHSYKYSKYSFDGKLYIKSISECGINKEEYEKKKIESVANLGRDEDKKENKTSIAVGKLFKYLKLKYPNMALKDLIEETECGLTYNYVRNLLYKSEEEKIELESKPGGDYIDFKLPHEIAREKGGGSCE